MAKKLHVGNLSDSVTQVQLHELFGQAGEIAEINLITDRDTGMPKGFAFVKMAGEEATQEAIKRFDGYSLDDQALTVQEARPHKPRSRGVWSSRSGPPKRNNRS
jgi:RNA recognition motif-containing protein